MEPEMKYAITKLHFRDPPSPESLGEGLVQVISSFCSHIVKLRFIYPLLKKVCCLPATDFCFLLSGIGTCDNSFHFIGVLAVEHVVLNAVGGIKLLKGRMISHKETKKNVCILCGDISVVIDIALFISFKDRDSSCFLR